jgi:hypothetical protein
MLVTTKIQSNKNATYQDKSSNMNLREEFSTQYEVSSLKSFHHGMP